MSGWVYVVLFLVVVLGFGMAVDWRRRHSTRGLDRRSAGDHGDGGHGVSSCGGAGCGGGSP